MVKSKLGNPKGLPDKPVLGKARPMAWYSRTEPAVPRIVPADQIDHSVLGPQRSFHNSHILETLGHRMKIAEAPGRWLD